MQEKKGEDLQRVLNKVPEVGLDEVGRGAVFGPVFSAVVILTEKNKAKQLNEISKSKETGETKNNFKADSNSKEKSIKKTNENKEVVSLEKKNEIEFEDEVNNARKKRRRSSASIE